MLTTHLEKVDLTIEIDSNEEFNLSGLRPARTNGTLANRIIEERQRQGLKVEHWNQSTLKEL